MSEFDFRPPDFHEDFSTDQWWKNWHYNCAGGASDGKTNLLEQPMNTSIIKGLAPNNSNALCVTMVKGDHSGTNFLQSIEKSRSARKLLFKYDIMLDAKDWNTTHRNLKGKTGKFMGPSSHCKNYKEPNHQAGYGGNSCEPLRRPNGSNGWSARMCFEVLENIGIRLGYYVYHIDQGQDFGDIFSWKGGKDSGIIIPGHWYTVGGHIVVNAKESDEENFKKEYRLQKLDCKQQILAIKSGLRGFLYKIPDDGNSLPLDQILNTGSGNPYLAFYTINNLRFSWDEYIPIENFWAHIYFGGIATPPHDLKVYFANISLWYG